MVVAEAAAAGDDLRLLRHPRQQLAPESRQAAEQVRGHAHPQQARREVADRRHQALGRGVGPQVGGVEPGLGEHQGDPQVGQQVRIVLGRAADRHRGAGARLGEQRGEPAQRREQHVGGAVLLEDPRLTLQPQLAEALHGAAHRAVDQRGQRRALEVARLEQPAHVPRVAVPQPLEQRLLVVAGTGLLGDPGHLGQAEDVGPHHRRAGLADEAHRVGNRDAAVPPRGPPRPQAAVVGPALDRRLAHPHHVGELAGTEEGRMHGSGRASRPRATATAAPGSAPGRGRCRPRSRPAGRRRTG